MSQPVSSNSGATACSRRRASLHNLVTTFSLSPNGTRAACQGTHHQRLSAYRDLCDADFEGRRSSRWCHPCHPVAEAATAADQHSKRYSTTNVVIESPYARSCTRCTRQPTPAGDASARAGQHSGAALHLRQQFSAFQRSTKEGYASAGRNGPGAAVMHERGLHRVTAIWLVFLTLSGGFSSLLLHVAVMMPPSGTEPARPLSRVAKRASSCKSSVFAELLIASSYYSAPAARPWAWH